MLATSLTAAVLGVEAHLVSVEADSAPGFPRFTMVGLADSAVRESESRIRAALRNCGLPFKWDRRITVNLAPASLRKGGSSFDLATALGARWRPMRRWCCRSSGACCSSASWRSTEACAPSPACCRCCSSRAATGSQARSSPTPAIARPPSPPGCRSSPSPRCPRPSRCSPAPSCRRRRPCPPRQTPRWTRPMPTWPTSAASRSRGERSRSRRRAATTCCSSARRAPARPCWLAACRASCLPSPSGRPSSAPRSTPLPACGRRRRSRRRPFRSPHHSTTEAALVGGGQRPRPGEVSLAHNGVLFLDELAEFRRGSLEALRQPLEEGFVTVARHRGVCRMPARFQLVGALNPCPCGRSGQPRLACRCTPGEVRGYLGRLSGPLLDRLDLHVSVPALAFDDVVGAARRAERGRPGPGAARARQADSRRDIAVQPSAPSMRSCLRPSFGASRDPTPSGQRLAPPRRRPARAVGEGSRPGFARRAGRSRI